MLTIRCPHCNSQLNIQEDQAGMTFTCPVCGKDFTHQNGDVPPVPVYAGNSCYNTSYNNTGTYYQYEKPNMFTAFTHYADFSGRATRREYWLFGIFTLVMQLFFNIAMGVLLFAFESAAAVMVVNCLGMVFSLAICIPSLAVSVRRCHDTGRSGWWVLISLVPCVGWIIYLVFMCTRSQECDNQWGAYPIADGVDEVWPCVVGIIIYVLLVVIVPVAMLLPALNSARDSARRASCINNLKQISIGISFYSDSYDGNTPPYKGRDGMELLRPEVGDNENLFRCPSATEGKNSYYYVGAGIEIPYIANPSSTPVVICQHHGDKGVHIAYADGHVAPLDGEYDSVEAIVRKALNGDTSSREAQKVLENARKIDNGTYR